MGRHHLFIVAFSRFLYTHRLAEGGGREEEWAATGLCPLTPAKEMGLPALHLPSLTSPLSCSTSHAVDGRAVLPPQTPCQLGSMFAMSIRLPSGTVPTFPLTGLLWDWAQCPPLRKHLGPSLQPLW